MTGIQALTEKEKETLRLLVDGHDAKSMARHLGLSVHTINERLRDARRKMSASSSRDAARQLRAIEGPHPEILRDKALGEAAAAPGMEEMTAPAETRRMGRPSGWIAGGLFMSFSLALLAFASMSGSADTPVAADRTANPAHFLAQGPVQPHDLVEGIRDLAIHPVERPWQFHGEVAALQSAERPQDGTFFEFGTGGFIDRVGGDCSIHIL